MAISEIDAIFSSNLKGKANAATSSRGTSQATKKTKKNKRKSTADEDDNNSLKPTLHRAVTSVKRKRAEPDTVMDPSAPVESAKRKKSVGEVVGKVTSSHSAKRKTANREGFERFCDSRGTAPRKKTEEGFSIYKEDELGIGDRGGDTPLCPFDCACCKYRDACIREVVAYAVYLGF
ncbi:hypothetical protein JB92DRAFT_2722274 [Gautieria morchelliformis]|nr:hypothetical protein JB92DRAFT_2722274 [Gautieria morchelliformis]